VDKEIELEEAQQFSIAEQKLGDALAPSPPSVAGRTPLPSARDLVHTNDLLCQQFIRVCGDQVRQRGEILLDILPFGGGGPCGALPRVPARLFSLTSAV
jgi:hypothetical protein